jgi:hypothetical protein
VLDVILRKKCDAQVNLSSSVRCFLSITRRVSGPMKFRLALQPAMTSFFAIPSGLADARTAEMNIDFSGLEHVEHPGVLLIQTVKVCIGCGQSWFTTPPNELAQLVATTEKGSFRV